MLKILPLILSVLCISGCLSNTEDAPIDSFCVLDLEHQHCHEKIFISKKNLSVKNGQDFPIDHADGGVVISMQDYLALKRWIIDQQTKPSSGK